MKKYKRYLFKKKDKETMTKKSSDSFVKNLAKIVLIINFLYQIFFNCKSCCVQIILLCTTDINCYYGIYQMITTLVSYSHNMLFVSILIILLVSFVKLLHPIFIFCGNLKSLVTLTFLVAS